MCAVLSRGLIREGEKHRKINTSKYVWCCLSLMQENRWHYGTWWSRQCDWEQSVAVEIDLSAQSCHQSAQSAMCVDPYWVTTQWHGLGVWPLLLTCLFPTWPHVGLWKRVSRQRDLSTPDTPSAVWLTAQTDLMEERPGGGERRGGVFIFSYCLVLLTCYKEITCPAIGAQSFISFSYHKHLSVCVRHILRTVLKGFTLGICILMSRGSAVSSLVGIGHAIRSIVIKCEWTGEQHLAVSGAGPLQANPWTRGTFHLLRSRITSHWSANGG